MSVEGRKLLHPLSISLLTIFLIFYPEYTRRPRHVISKPGSQKRNGEGMNGTKRTLLLLRLYSILIPLGSKRKRERKRDERRRDVTFLWVVYESRKSILVCNCLSNIHPFIVSSKLSPCRIREHCRAFTVIES